jgi:hypothetical protein
MIAGQLIALTARMEALERRLRAQPQNGSNGDASEENTVLSGEFSI